MLEDQHWAWGGRETAAWSWSWGAFLFRCKHCAVPREKTMMIDQTLASVWGCFIRGIDYSNNYLIILNHESRKIIMQICQRSERSMLSTPSNVSPIPTHQAHTSNRSPIPAIQTLLMPL